jgi:acyl carrier protein phosphodiesterase
VNWLAHLVLSPPVPLVRLGNLAGDFVQGTAIAALHPEVQRGIALHRAIDRFVDTHPIVRGGRDRLQPPFRRFGGVLLDVWFDHFLARDFSALVGQPLPTFLAVVHRDLRQHRAELPLPLQQIAERFAADGWLRSYAEVAGIEHVLALMGRRLARENPLARGAEPLRQHYAALATDFAALWPEVRAFSARLVEARNHGTAAPG